MAEQEGEAALAICCLPGQAHRRKLNFKQNFLNLSSELPSVPPLKVLSHFPRGPCEGDQKGGSRKHQQEEHPLKSHLSCTSPPSNLTDPREKTAFNHDQACSARESTRAAPSLHWGAQGANGPTTNPDFHPRLSLCRG